MVRNAIGAILNALPSTAGSFNGSQYPLPVAQTFMGNASFDLEAIRRSLLDRANDDPKTILAPLLIAVEQIEAASPDNAEYFLDDRKVQSLVFTGSKWRAGWALVLGNAENAAVASLLAERDFMVFTDQPGIEGAIFIGGRDTSPIYFLQLMVRYGLIWGRIAPGKDHEMGHFLETDMPGFLAITEDLPPVKYLVTLGLMKLGPPPSSLRHSPFRMGHVSWPERRVRSSTEGAVFQTCASAIIAGKWSSCRPSAIPHGHPSSSSRKPYAAAIRIRFSACGPRRRRRRS